MVRLLVVGGLPVVRLLNFQRFCDQVTLQFELGFRLLQIQDISDVL